MNTAETPLQATHWHGPTLTLKNDLCSVEIAPRIGRVISFCRNGTPNWFAPLPEKPLAPNQAWPSYNGDKLWPTAQFLWPQIYGDMIPDPNMDKGNWQVAASDLLSVTLVSEISAPLGLRATRKITLHATKAELTQRYTLLRVLPSQYPVCVWTVSSCALADYIALDCQTSPRHAGGRKYHTFGNRTYPLPNVSEIQGAQSLRFDWPASGSSKVGTYGNWVALVRGAEAFMQTVDWDQSACYLEESSLQAWVGIENGFCEIETSSPYWHLRVGEQRDWEIKWELVSDFSPPKSL